MPVFGRPALLDAALEGVELAVEPVLEPELDEPLPEPELDEPLPEPELDELLPEPEPDPLEGAWTTTVAFMNGWIVQ